MKKLILTISFILFLSFLQFAQIPNPGFENWANGDPVDWYTLDILGDAVSQSSERHSGLSAAKLQIIDFSGSPIPPILTSGNFIFSQKYASLTGYYKFVPQNNKTIVSLFIIIFDGSNVVGSGSWETGDAMPNFSPFTAPLTYIEGSTPDSAYIQVVVVDTSDEGSGGIGSYALIDDLSLEGTVGINDEDNNTIQIFKLSQNYPNPFNPNTIINYSLEKSSQVSLKVYDALGNEVAALVDEFKPAGYYEVNFNASRLSSGIYFYKLTAGNFSEVKKMTLLR